MDEFRDIGTSKYRLLSENKIEWITSDWWSIEYDFSSLTIDLEIRGIDSDTIKEIIIHIEEGDDRDPLQDLQNAIIEGFRKIGEKDE
jgi:hypothetical protein